MKRRAEPGRVSSYLGAFFAVVLVASLRWLLMPVLGADLPFITLFFAVFFAAWLGGLGPALLATALSLIISAYLFLPPIGALLPLSGPALIGSAIFLVNGVAVGWMGEARLRSQAATRRLVAVADGERIRAEEQAVHAEEETARAEEEYTRAETESLRARDAARRAEAESDRVQRILSSISDAFIVLDRNWIIVYLNEQAAAITARSREELLGRDLWQSFPEALGTPIDLALRRAVATGTVIRLETLYPPLDKWLRVAAYPSADGLSVFIQDVTEQRRMELALQDSTDELEASNQALKAALDELADRSAAAEEGQRRIASILESIGDGFYFLDRDWRFIYVNERAAASMGRPASDLIGVNLWELFPQLRGSAFDREFHRAMRDRTMVTLEESSVLNEAWMSVRVYPTDDGLSVFFEDITEQRKAARALAESEERLRLATDVGGFGIWDWDIPANRVTWSPRVYQFHGLAEGEFGGRVEDFRALVHPEDAQRVEQAIRAALDRKSEYQIEFRAVRPTGEIRWLLTNGRVVFDDRGQAVRMVGATQDVTQRRESEERLRQVQRIESAGRIAGGVAHEVNNQMTVVLGLTEFMLRSPDLSPEIKADALQIRRAGERSALITAQLLAFSRRQVLWPTQVDLNQIIADFERVLRKTAGEDVTLVLRLQPDLPPVLADRAQMEQVLLNLTLNAADAMKRTGGTLTIETGQTTFSPDYITTKPDISIALGRYVRLAVSDTGEGMSPQVRDHIFEPFFTTKPIGQGSGLGLSSVYGIVKQSDGYIWAYSEPGGGATLKIYLPVAAETAQAAPSGELPAPIGGTETIMIVEDEPDLRFLFSRILRELGYRAVEASDGREALTILRGGASPVDLVITDMAMPGMNGRELGNHIKREFPSVPVLYMSGYTDADIVARGLLEQDVPFIQKPFMPDAIARHLRQALDHAAGRGASS